MPRKKRTEPEKATDQPTESVPAVGTGESVLTDECITVAFTQAIVFVMDGQRYALPIEAVQEIQQIVEYTTVPATAPALVGMIDLRGSVVPLVDLRLMLGLSAAPYHLDTPLVFAHTGERLIAYIVDEVEDVIDLSGVQLQAPSRLYALSERLFGVVRIGDGLLFVLDPECLVPADALILRDAVAEGGDQ